MKISSDLPPIEVVTRFLTALETQDHDVVSALLAPGLHYTNVSLPTLKGGEMVAKLMRAALRKGTGFKVQVHRIASNGDVVMTERTDVLRMGPLHIRFWVCGTFRVHDGRITLWRDYFDWFDFGKGTVRGIAGIAFPRLRASLPISVES